MNLANEQDRSAFSDPESIARRRRYLPKSSGRTASLSMSSSLDANDEPAEPYHFQKGNNEVFQGNNAEGGVDTCPLEQQHQGKKLLHVIVALPVDFIFSLIFVQEQVMLNVYQARKVSDVVNSPYQEDKDSGQLSRQVTYTMSLNLANFGTKLSYVTEMQTIQHSKQGYSYVVATEAVNNGIPYADSFSMFCHYCLLREPDGRTKITVWTQVKYKKPIWGVVKGMLERNAYNGVEAFQAELLSQITLVAERSERKGNRPSAATRTKTHTRTNSHGYKRQKPGKEIPKETTTSNHWNIWIAVSMIVAFVMLILSNYILYTKLHHLELRATERRPATKPSVAKYLDNGKLFESKSRFLQHYHTMQDEQIQTWKTTVSDANLLLQQVQDSLEMMLDKIKDNEDSMVSVLEEFNSKENVSGEEKVNDSDNNDNQPVSSDKEDN